MLAGMHSLPPLTAVRVFEAAARHENFTRAAAELGITQTAVSHQIGALEQRLGVSLFARSKGRVRLTEAGRRIAPRLGVALGIMEEAFGELHADDQAVLSISTLQTFATNWLAPRLGSFHLNFPELALRLRTESRLVDFSSGELHAAIRIGHGEWPGLKQHFLFRQHFSPMCSPGFADRHGLQRPERLLAVERFGPEEAWWRDWLAGVGVEAPLQSQAGGVGLDNQVMEANAAIAGVGVAMLTPFLWRSELESGRLVQPFAHVHYSAKSHWLVYPESKRSQPKIIGFRTWLMEALREATGKEPTEMLTAPAA